MDGENPRFSYSRAGNETFLQSAGSEDSVLSNGRARPGVLSRGVGRRSCRFVMRLITGCYWILARRCFILPNRFVRKVLFQFFARLEVWHSLRLNINWLTGLGIASAARTSFPFTDASEST